MSTFIKKSQLKYLLSAAAVLVIAFALVVSFSYEPESAPGQVTESAVGQASQTASPSGTEEVPSFIDADYPYYPSLGQMKKESDAIVKGTVLSVEQRDINISLEADRDEYPAILPFWVSKVRIEKSIKGDFAEGDVIEVKQLVMGESGAMPKAKSRGIMFLGVYPYGIPSSPLSPTQGVVPVRDGVVEPADGDEAMPRGLKEDAFMARVRAAN